MPMRETILKEYNLLGFPQSHTDLWEGKYPTPAHSRHRVPPNKWGEGN